MRFFHLSFFLALLFLSACVDISQPRTRQQKNLNRRAFETISAPVDDSDFDYVDENCEEETIGCASEEKIDSKFYKRISIAITENMKMREVLTQMANLASINIFIAQDIEGSISFSAKNRPFIDILKDICSSSGLKYAILGNSVKIEVDLPTLKVYKIPSLNIQRDAQSSISISTDIFNGSFAGIDAGTPSGSQANNGSNSLVSETSKNDFWAELEDALKVIIGESDDSYVSVHRQSGLITAYVPQSKHEEIKKYIDTLRETSEEQVLIEAKIIEVNLKDEFRSGINWHIMRNGGATLNKSFDTTDGLFSFGVNRTSLSALSGFIEKFGAVKTLSSPRITILNNHSAILKVAQNEIVYFPEFQKQYTGRNSENMTDLLSTNVKTIPIGLIMKVQPSIDRKNNSVLLTLRPTVSKIAAYKEIPFLFSNYVNKDSAAANIPQTIKMPIVDVRELDSVLKVRSGQIIVMGGLMQEKSHNNRSGLPGFMDTPADYLSGERNRETDVTELVIFLRATILRKKSKKYHNADKKIYNTFSSDPRQLKFDRK